MRRIYLKDIIEQVSEKFPEFTKKEIHLVAIYALKKMYSHLSNPSTWDIPLILGTSHKIKLNPIKVLSYGDFKARRDFIDRYRLNSKNTSPHIRRYMFLCSDSIEDVKDFIACERSKDFTRAYYSISLVKYSRSTNKTLYVFRIPLPKDKKATKYINIKDYDTTNAKLVYRRNALSSAP